MPHYCRRPTLKYLREDSHHVVYAQRPENIQPRVVSDWLVEDYGEDHFQISLRKGVMVIYIDRDEVHKREREQQGGRGEEAAALQKEAETTEQGAAKTEDMATYKRRSLDVKLAQRVLREEWWR